MISGAHIPASPAGTRCARRARRGCRPCPGYRARISLIVCPVQRRIARRTLALSLKPTFHATTSACQKRTQAEYRVSASLSGTLADDINWNFDTSFGRDALNEIWRAGPAGSSFCIGFANGSPVSDRYAMPGTFTGTIHGVIVEARGDYHHDPELETHIALNED